MLTLNHQLNSKNKCWIVRDLIRSVYHSGDLGDIVYSLLWCKKELGSINLILGPDPRWELRHQMDEQLCEFLRPLLESQDWIYSVEYQHGVPKQCICLNDFRKTWFGHRRSSNLFEAYAEHYRTPPLPENESWLNAVPVSIPDKPVVIARSHRYRNPKFPWYNVSKRYKGLLAFVGLKNEYDDWRNLYGNSATYYPVKDALEMASVIAGSQLFIGNQSFPMSLALALNVRLIQEVGHPNADCRFKRPNAIFYEKGPFMLPVIE